MPKINVKKFTLSALLFHPMPALKMSSQESMTDLLNANHVQIFAQSVDSPTPQNRQILLSAALLALQDTRFSKENAYKPAKVANTSQLQIINVYLVISPVLVALTL